MEPFYGAILETDIRDYKLGWSTIEIQKAPFSETHEYNQLEFSKEFGSNLCTLYAPIGMLSDLTGKDISERHNLCAIRSKMPDFDPSIGGYLVEWNNCVRKWWNEANPTNQIRQFSVTIGDDNFMDALEKGYRINIGYRGNRKYNEDSNDGVLDNYDIGITSYWHSTTCKLVNGNVIVDNYKGVKKFNTYSIKDFNAFLKSGIVFNTAYLFLFANDAIDSEIALLKDKWKDSGITFNADKIKEYAEFLKK